MRTIKNTDDTIDSRDVIERIEELETLGNDGDLDSDEAEELRQLRSLAEEAESSPDWQYGETLIHEKYFTTYTDELISDCYPIPKEMESGEWPWRHMSIDYESAAKELKQDYFEVDFGGETYLIRA